jgi:hypothetical protein
MTLSHPAQLLVCHQRIAAPRGYVRRDQRPPGQFCNLPAFAWCFDCRMYVCDIHGEARHHLHETRIEHPENASAAALQSA